MEVNDVRCVGEMLDLGYRLAFYYSTSCGGETFVVAYHFVLDDGLVRCCQVSSSVDDILRLGGTLTNVDIFYQNFINKDTIWYTFCRGRFLAKRQKVVLYPAEWEEWSDNNSFKCEKMMEDMQKSQSRKQPSPPPVEKKEENAYHNALSDFFGVKGFDTP